MLSNCLFTTSREEHNSAHKMHEGVVQPILENLDFTASTMTSTRKCLSYSGLCRPSSAILRMLKGCSAFVARKLLQPVTNEPDELKFITHLNIDKFVLNVPAVAVASEPDFHLLEGGRLKCHTCSILTSFYSNICSNSFVKTVFNAYSTYYV